MNEDFMLEAIHEAEIALLLKEVPVGAVVVKGNTVIARAHNLRETLNDPTAHAEMLAIRKAAAFLQSWRLNECSMYVTLEPCPMCAGAILQSRISNLYIGTFDPTAGACGSVINILQSDSLNHWTRIHWNYNNKCSNMLSNFFKNRR
ncbi:nucleoside deaminase [Clostridium sp. CX1]|uniref:tRNA-specific adenosine deaminase n=1 Tax=Clostridium tanneri TaxID=3037988 RepID=A0ABU4JXT0_9CLOT|nr:MULTISPECIES: nucleoside deaminase [unclassified Clostridium]MCT8978732.1 nucleoside deaminase [Clostridium sp. CX1]MDW8802969.1 nucleoside deaminase [Clostridium sp. A1-XYC3]